MSNDPEIAALVGATGGAGTTRLAVEVGVALAAAGRDVLVVDAALATQGLSRYVDGRLEPDLTTVLVQDGHGDGNGDGATAEDPVPADTIRPIAGGPDGPGDGRPGLDERGAHPSSGGAETADEPAPGRLDCVPSYAPFARLARAQTADAARRFERLLADAADRFDRVLVDCPPLASNLAVAAATAADRVAVVAPASPRGADAVQRTRGRLADVGADEGLLVANRAAEGHPVGAADVAVPAADLPDGTAAGTRAPASFRHAMGGLAAALCGVEAGAGEPPEGLAKTVADRIPTGLGGRR